MEKESIKESIEVQSLIIHGRTIGTKMKIERIVYNDKILENMKNKKLKILKRELNKIHESLIEEKKRYSLENKKKIRNNSKELYDFF